MGDFDGDVKVFSRQSIGRLLCVADSSSAGRSLESRNKIITSLIRRCEQLGKISRTAMYGPPTLLKPL